MSPVRRTAESRRPSDANIVWASSVSVMAVSRVRPLPSRRYVWQNLPLDVGHVLTYFVAHEAHHRGQIVMIARQLGQRLPQPVTNGLWWWKPAPSRSRRSSVRVHSHSAD